MSWARRVAGGWLLAIHAQPGAKRSGIVGMHGDALKVRIAAPPAGGRANDGLVAFVAEALGVPKKSVTVVKGARSRQKTVWVAAHGVDPAQLLRLQSRNPGDQN
ncbi:MAG TPA: DUF167 domain-containing protein [Burkholderiales bacterium]